MGFIYGHKLKNTNRWYIGQTIKKRPEYRWGLNGTSYLKRNPNSHFANAIKKYGWDAFEHVILEENVSIEKLDEREQYYIKEYNAVEKGFNSTYGGNANHKVSNKTKQKLSISSKKMWEEKGEKMRDIYSSEEHRKKLSVNISKTYVEHPELREKASEIAKQFCWMCNETEIIRIYKSNLKTYQELGYQQGRTFINKDLGQYIIHNYIENDYSIAELALKYGVDRKIIERYLLKNNIEVVNKNYRIGKKTRGKSKSEDFKKIVCESTKKRRTGKVWVYKNGEKSKEISIEELQTYLKNGWIRGRGKINKANMPHKELCKKILCIETKIIYEGIRPTARLLKIPKSTLQAALNNPNRTAGGYHWKYIER